ncbi:hypothetical protein TNCV_3575121 [Trichonephila clavipes]|nr:hypothetical protein TNCV_3575121 [Trichonephila clavipes]
MPVSGKSFASAASKTYKSIAIQVGASTAPTFEKAESEKPKTIAVDTRKTVSTPSNVKRHRKIRIRESGVLVNKKRDQTSPKSPTTWERMSWKSMHPKATKV